MSEAPHTLVPMTKTYLDVTGPYDLGEIATMGFGHRDERSFDGVMRMAFCLDGDYERQVGVEARQRDDRMELQSRRPETHSAMTNWRSCAGRSLG